jgi:hypothetical protein
MSNDPGFMIPLNLRDFLFPQDSGQRNICTAANQQTYTKAPWWTCENIQLPQTVDAVTARVGDSVVIEVGIQGLVGAGGETAAALIQHVQAWVCYPNTVAGGGNATLVVPSMQNNKFASFTNPNPNAPLVFGSGNTFDYQSSTDGAFQWISLTAWTPTEEDFLEQADQGGHCCVIANAAGLSDYEEETNDGESVGVNITDSSQLHSDINICTKLWQGQRNIAIVPTPKGGKRRLGFAFLSGAPGRTERSRTTVSVTAIDQGGEVDPILHKVLASGPYAGLSLKAASSAPLSLRLAKHDYKSNNWLCKIIHEAEAIVEESLGLATHPFGGGHQMHLNLPPQGLQPLGVTIELDPTEPPGTVHAIEIIQIDADGSRGGIRAGIVVT